MNEWLSVANEISRTENGKQYELDLAAGIGKFGLEARTGPIHYKESYADSDPWLDIDAEYTEESAEGLVYPKLPNIITAYNPTQKLGYKIQNRNNPNHIITVELYSVNGILATPERLVNLDFDHFFRIHPYRVGIWKRMKQALKKDITIRWKITEVGRDASAIYVPSQVTNPLAYSISDILNVDDPEQYLVQITTQRTDIDEHSWYWNEIIPKGAMLVDTDFNIAAGTDDGYRYTGTTFNRSGNYTIFGNIIGSSHSFFRFANVTIPTDDATISSAYITFKAYTSSSGEPCHAIVYGNDADNAAAPTTYGEFDALVLTTASASWSNVPSWTVNYTYQTPSFVSVVQEIVDRAGWASGNAVQILINDNSSDGGCNRRPYSEEYGSGENSAIFTVTWTVPSTGNAFYLFNNLNR
jgi:hypothetical protein